MADRSSAEIFGAIFEILARNPDKRNKTLAYEIYGLTKRYDFMDYQMEADLALHTLGFVEDDEGWFSPPEGY